MFKTILNKEPFTNIKQLVKNMSETFPKINVFEVFGILGGRRGNFGCLSLERVF